MNEIENMLGEVWKQWKDTKYYFSNCGRIKKKLCRKVVLKEPWTKEVKGIKRKLITMNYKEYVVARCVYELFVGEIPEGYVVHHKDNCYFNNDVRNLELLTREELGNKIKYRGRTNKRVYCIDNGKYYRSMEEASKDLYVSRSTISHICNGHIKDSCVRVRFVKD